MSSQEFSEGNPNLHFVKEPFLDYFYDGGSKRAYAYKVGEAFLCYQLTTFSTLTGRTIPAVGISSCYFFPQKIDDVVDAMKGVK